jgi:hypothetical protein
MHRPDPWTPPARIYSPSREPGWQREVELGIL